MEELNIYQGVNFIYMLKLYDYNPPIMYGIYISL